MKCRLFPVLISALLLGPAGMNGATGKPDFSGTWQQDNDRCVPKRSGDVTLKIDDHDPDLVVETTMLRPSGPPRHALQRYTTNGKSSISTGADGDEFHTSIVHQGQTLVFSIEEHEDGRILRSREIWMLIDNGTALQREREELNSLGNPPQRKTLVYLRKSPGPVSR